MVLRQICIQKALLISFEMRYMKGEDKNFENADVVEGGCLQIADGCWFGGGGVKNPGKSLDVIYGRPQSTIAPGGNQMKHQIFRSQKQELHRMNECVSEILKNCEKYLTAKIVECGYQIFWV